MVWESDVLLQAALVIIIIIIAIVNGKGGNEKLEKTVYIIVQ
jgi:hypothetical protein